MVRFAGIGGAVACPSRQTLGVPKPHSHCPMFGLFPPSPFEHPSLGRLAWRRGHWRGGLSLPRGIDISLVLSGTRKGPDEAAIAEAVQIPANVKRWRTAIDKALFEHYEPYAKAIAAGQVPKPDHDIPKFHRPEDVSKYSSLLVAVVTPLEGVMTIELCYGTLWDVEHMLGARFQRGQLLELCGSTIPP